MRQSQDTGWCTVIGMLTLPNSKTRMDYFGSRLKRLMQHMQSVGSTRLAMD